MGRWCRIQECAGYQDWMDGSWFDCGGVAVLRLCWLDDDPQQWNAGSKDHTGATFVGRAQDDGMGTRQQMD